MKNLILSTVAVFSMAGAAFAQPVVSGEVELKFSEQASGDWGGAMGLDLGVDVSGLASVDLDFSATDGNAVTLDNWAVGTTVGGVGVALGDDLGVMPGAEGEQTLAAPAMAEAVRVTVGDAQVAVGFTDWTADVTDISNIQGAYTIDMNLVAVTAAADYNLDSENTVLAAGLSGFEVGSVASLGGALTYDVDAESIGYEAVANAMGITAYVNGDDTDALQNIGGEYSYMLGGANLTAGGVYNIDNEDLTPSVSLSFAF